MTESLRIAREKLASVLEIYAPTDARVRGTAVVAMTAVLQEFEAAVREDEQATVTETVETVGAEVASDPAM